MDDYDKLKQLFEEFKKSFWENKNSLWFLFGVWIGMVISGIAYLIEYIWEI